MIYHEVAYIEYFKNIKINLFIIVNYDNELC
jgi:hypothetical protein